MNSLEIQRLIQTLSKLPGLGPRSGRRLALHLLKNREKTFRPLIDVMHEAETKVVTCHQCHNLDTHTPCTLCQDSKRDSTQLCVVEDVSDLWAIERARIFPGKYHVLGGVLSAIDGIGPQHLYVSTLLDRLSAQNIKEIVLALSATVDGQTTLHYLTDQLKGFKGMISTLAHGVPVGGELDYLDEGTLFTAFQSRRSVL